ncbi:FkbM family methyltransferase [Lentzea sp.]|uniref:FkbM family methyltransferase n=1 Tax=Lentzea sp. TaxID=56099 RepID=UPI002D1AAE54|nr:FkbM family methyltransferase [Lentzea sp.]HUQ55574.1 FkbM family methyltransferase [Lentzea sp.]
MTAREETDPAALVAAVGRRRRDLAGLATRVRDFLKHNKGVEHVEVRVESSGRLRAVVWVAPTPSGLGTCALPDGTVVTDLNHYETTYLYQEILVDRAYRPEALDLPPDAVVLDIGANIGMFCLSMARWLPDCRVVAFEPAPDAYAALVANVEDLALPVTCLPWAVGAESGRTTMTVYPAASVFSSLNADPDADRSAMRAAIGVAADEGGTDVVDQVAADRVSGAIEVPVEVRRLSDAFDELGLTYVDLLKLDAEGAELDILGHLRPEDLAKIGNVVMEVHTTSDRRALVDLLENAGFTCHLTDVPALEGTGFVNLYAFRQTTSRRPATRPEVRPPIPPLTARQRLRQALDSFLGAEGVSVEVRTGPAPVTPAAPADAVDPESVPGLAEAWQHAVGSEPGGTADFFELGGTSMAAVRMLSQLHREHGYELKLDDFLASPTASALAALCTRTV